MIRVNGLTITVFRDDHIIVDGLDFVINDGEKCALIGEEGDGKSTVLKWLYDPALVENYAQVSGSRYVSGKCGYLSQELTKEDSLLPVGEWMDRICELYSVSPAKAAKAAEELHIDTELLYEERPMATLSGGERVKVQIASLILSDCDTLLLDEPSNDLDLETLEWLEDFIRRTRKTVLFVSHDEVLLENTAEMLLHFELVRRKKIPRATAVHLGYREYMEQRRAGMEQQSRVASFERKAFREKKERYLSIMQAVDHAQNTISRADPSGGRLLKKKMHAVKSLGRRLEEEEKNLTRQPEAEWAILPKIEEGVELKNGKVVLDYGPADIVREGKVLCRDVSLFVRGPEHICIIGRNGCGKSTLLESIADELLLRRDISAFYMPQKYDDVLDIEKDPVSFLVPGGDKERVTKARLYLGSMKYTTDEMLHPVSALSGGQRAKLLLLKAILEKANVLILDEPTRNFSPLSAPAVRELLASFLGAIISVSHDRLYIDAVADTVYELTPEGLQKKQI